MNMTFMEVKMCVKKISITINTQEAELVWVHIENVQRLHWISSVAELHRGVMGGGD